MYRIIFVFAIGILNATAVFGAEGDIKANDLLQKIKRNLGYMQNVQYTVRYDDFTSKLTRDATIKQLEKYGEDEITIAKLKKRFSEQDGYTSQIQKLVYDNNDHMKIQLSDVSIDAKGKEFFEETRTSTWDGKKSVDLVESNGGKISGAGINSKKPADMDFQRKPSKSFGGDCLASFEQAIVKNEQISISCDANGLYKVEFENNNRRTICWIDSKKGHSVTREENYHGNNLEKLTLADYAMFDKVWFPVSGVVDVYTGDDSQTLLMRNNVTIYDIIINAPSLASDVFDIPLKEGTVVQDHVKGIRYKVGDASSVKSLRNGEPQ